MSDQQPQGGGAPRFDRADEEALVALVERFANEEIAPFVTAWDAAGAFPRPLYQRASELGLLGLGYPDEFGGTPATHRMKSLVSQTFARVTGSGGVHASLYSHSIGLPPILKHGSAALKQEIVPPVLRGEKISALGITEPGGGSDVAAIKTTAIRTNDGQGDDFLINGEKTFITSGVRCDFLTAAVRTGDAGSKGARYEAAVVQRASPCSSFPCIWPVSAAPGSTKWAGTPPTQRTSGLTMCVCPRACWSARRVRVSR